MGDCFLSWPFFDEFHSTFAKDFRRWVFSELQSYEYSDGGDGLAAREIFELLGHGNWLKNTIVGNNGKMTDRRNLRTICLMREILGYRSAIADIALSEPWLAILPIALFSPESTRHHDLIRGYLVGKMLPAFALSEPEAGSDVASIQTRAQQKGDYYILNGEKTWTSNAGTADVYVVFAQTGKGSDAHGLSAFIVDSHLPGISVKKDISVLSPHSVGTIGFDNVYVPGDRLIGEPGQGFMIAITVLEMFRPTVGAATVGMARRAMDEAIARSVKRKAFGKLICEHQLIQGMLANMAIKIDSSALLVYRAAWMNDVRKIRNTRQAAMAKLHATEMAQQVIDQAQQIFGGLGVVKDTVVERLYRHIRAFRIFDGTSEIQKLIIAKNLIQEYRDKTDAFN